MRLYRLHYGSDITQGIFRGQSGNENYNIYTIKSEMKLAEDFYNISQELHCPKETDFVMNPTEKSLFYFKESFYIKNKHIFDSFTLTASEYNIIVNVYEINLGEIQSYNCIYQDENQMCLEIE